jgi:hypothetical protein
MLNSLVIKSAILHRPDTLKSEIPDARTFPAPPKDSVGLVCEPVSRSRKKQVQSIDIANLLGLAEGAAGGHVPRPYLKQLPKLGAGLRF